MSELERIRRDLQEHAAEEDHLDDDPAFEVTLSAALAEHEWSEATMDALSQIVEPQPLSGATRLAAVERVLRELGGDAADLDLAATRRRAGMSEDEAATMLGTDAARLRRMEGTAAGRWLELQPAAVSQYLERIGLSTIRFARWLSARMGGPEHAFGYRPGVLAEHHVEVETEQAAHVLWLETLLTAPDADRHENAPAASVFGVEWDPSALERGRAQMARRVRAALLRQLATLDAREATSVLGTRLHALRERSVLIALPTESGYRYPAFQFDRPDQSIRRVVAYCNERLHPDRDPWGAVSWWVTDHDWLGRPPLAVLDDPTGESRLRQAADMIGQYDG